jgi:hypothetical protein
MNPQDLDRLIEQQTLVLGKMEDAINNITNAMTALRKGLTPQTFCVPLITLPNVNNILAPTALLPHRCVLRYIYSPSGTLSDFTLLDGNSTSSPRYFQFTGTGDPNAGNVYVPFRKGIYCGYSSDSSAILFGDLVDY